MPEDYPTGPRYVGAALGVLVALFLAACHLYAFIVLDAPIALAVLSVATAIPVLFFLLLALAPDPLQRLLSRFTALNLRDGGHVAAAVVMALALFHVLGVNAAAGGVYALEEVYADRPHEPGPPWDAPGAPPANLTANLTEHGVNLTWDNATGNATYRVYRGLDGNATYRFANATNASFTDDDVLVGRAYHYRVTQVDAGGNESAPSAPAAVLVPIPPSLLFEGLAQNLLVMVLPALLYVSFVHGGGPASAARALGLRMEGLGRAVLIGSVAVVAFMFLLGVAITLLQDQVHVGENERAVALGIGLTIGGAFLVAAGSSVSEEVFFRGFLQPRVGILAQAVLFAVAHVSYVDVLEVVVVFLLAFLFALLYRFTRNLWAPIAAHFLFNLINLLGIICGPDGSGCTAGF